MTTPSERPRANRDHINKSLRLRLRIFSIVFLALCGVLVFDIVQRHFDPLIIVVGVAIGVLIGIVLSRMSHLRWNEENQQVIARMDALGVAILVLYLLFSLTRTQLLSVWVQGNALAALTTGTMLGRIIGTMRGIRGVLSAWGFETARPPRGKG